MEISLKAYGKINLGLDVVRRREDGYHEVKMIMQTVDLWDELTFLRCHHRRDRYNIGFVGAAGCEG